MSKQLWILAYDEIYNAAIDEGLSEDDAHKKAEKFATATMIDRLMEDADNARKRARENG